MLRNNFIPIKNKIFLFISILLSITFYYLSYFFTVDSGFSFQEYKHLAKIPLNSCLAIIGNDMSKSYDIQENIEKIIFTINSENINIIGYDGSKLQIILDNNCSDNPKINSNIVSNQMIFDIDSNTLIDSNLLLRIPQNLHSLKTIKVTNMEGDLSISDLNINTLESSSSKGNVDLSDSKISHLNISSSTGDINLKSTSVSDSTKLSTTSGNISAFNNLENLICITDSGNVNIKINELKNNAYIKTKSGTVSLRTDQKYNINFNTVLGELHNNSNNILNKENDGCSINIYTFTGDLYLD